MKINWKLAILFTGAIAFSASPVLANAGTPLMWTAFQHLFLGNALIGLIESFVLSSWFNIPSSVGVITTANYASAWVGAILEVKSPTIKVKKNKAIPPTKSEFRIEFQIPQSNQIINHPEMTVTVTVVPKISKIVALSGIETKMADATINGTTHNNASSKIHNTALNIEASQIQDPG